MAHEVGRPPFEGHASEALEHVPSGRPEKPDQAPAPVTDGVARWIAVAALAGLSVWSLIWAESHDIILGTGVTAVLPDVSWYAAGAVIVLVVWRRWSPGWVLLIPWAAPVVYNNLVDLLTPLFVDAWPENAVFGGLPDLPKGGLAYAPASFSIDDVVCLALGLALAYAIWRQSRAWRSSFDTVRSELVDPRARRAVLIGALALLAALVVLDAYVAAGWLLRSLELFPDAEIDLVAAIIAVAFYLDAAPRLGVWAFAIAGAYWGGDAIAGLFALLGYHDMLGLGGATGMVTILLAVAALVELVWATFLVRAALVQHGLTVTGQEAGDNHGAGGVSAA